MTRSRDVASILTAASTLATDVETAAAVSAHSSASDPHGDRANATSTYIPKSLVTTKGDLVVATASGVVDRLAAGSNSQTLVADSAEATGLKWATPSSGMTFIARTTFSNVASQAFDSVFTSTYKNYLVVFDNIYAATASDKLQLQFRYSGNTTQTSGLYSNCVWARANAATVTNEYITNGTQANIGYTTGSSTTQGSGFMYVSQVGNSSTTAIASGQYFEGQGVYGGSFNALSSTARTYDGFLLKSSSTNITGTVSIYGLAAA